MTPDVELIVTARTDVADGIVALDLASPTGEALPAWEPGAHIDVLLAEDLVRQYSLCGDPAKPTTWRIAVLREKESRGGSQYVHDKLDVGTTLSAGAPRNHFPLEKAESYAFVAGGIGITPLIPMIAAAESEGAQWRLTYGARNRTTIAFADELLARYEDRVRLVPQDTLGLIDLSSATRDADAVYACGPEALLTALEQTCRPGVLHLERFSPRPVSIGADESFEVELAKSECVLTVPAGVPLLKVLRDNGYDIDFCCEEGVCGSCETTVLSGTVDHRDSVLTEEQRGRHDVMFPCVSRAAAGRLVLDV